MSARVAVYAIPGIVAADGPVAAAVRSIAEEHIAHTRAARRYGYHATLKAPIRLRDGLTVDGDFAPAVAAFAGSHGPASVPALAVTGIGGFFALTAGEPAPELYALADEVVTALDGLRAAPTEAELARRQPERLSERQRELLARWGYPYVLDQFRFHLTLTDELPEADRPAVGARLLGAFAEHLGAELPVSALAVCVEPEPGADFFVHSVHPLTHQEAR